MGEPMKNIKTQIYISILCLLLTGSLFCASVNEISFNVRQLREFLTYTPDLDGQILSAADSLVIQNRKAEIQQEINALLASSRERYTVEDITVLGYLQDQGVLSIENREFKRNMKIRMSQEEAEVVTSHPGNFYLEALRELDQNLSWVYYNWTLKGYNTIYYEEEEEINNIPEIELVSINPETMVDISYQLYKQNQTAKTALENYQDGDYRVSLNQFLAEVRTGDVPATHYFWIAMNYLELGEISNAKYYLEQYLQTFDPNYVTIAQHYLDLIAEQENVFRRVRVNENPIYLSSDEGESHFTVSPDGTYLYFCSGRPAAFAKTNVWRAERLNNSWAYPELVEALSTNSDEALCSFSSNGMRAYLMGKYEQGRQDYDIYTSDDKNGWTSPVRLTTVNSDQQEIDPYVYQDRLMLFSSNRPGGFGGYDIYISIYNDGSWQRPFNLGANVNTAGDEIAPFLDWDGKTIFFSSNGYRGFGGYDIYKAVVLDGEAKTWSRAENVGAPVNSAYNDRAFYHLRNSNEAILLSDRARRGVLGIHPLSLEYAPRSYFIKDSDGQVKRVQDKDNTSPLSGLLTQVVEEEYLEIWGTVLNDKNVPVQAELRFSYDRDGIHYHDLARPDEQGNYSIYLPVSKEYILDTNPSGYSMYSTRIKPPSQSSRVRQDLRLEPLDLDKVFVFSNIQFDYDSAVLKAESYPILNEIALTLLNNPTIRVEISGHTCENQGGEKYNTTLSENRAAAVLSYLKGKGVNANRMISVGYGLSRPLNNNLSEEDKALNRRVEVKIIK